MIVFPMAGLSRRFTDAGYQVPKYMLQAHGRSLFAHAVGGFASFFDTTPFLFVLRDIAGTRAFVEAECRALGVRDVRISALEAPTRGQAETVALGIADLAIGDETPLTVFNIDTFRPGFRFPDWDMAKVDGYLEVFRGSGANWSYVRPADGGGNRVLQTTEKVPISDLCCTGLYHFRSNGLFQKAYRETFAGGADAAGLAEFYVAPMYNALIAQGCDIRYSLIENHEVIFCGVPAEYLAFLADGGQAR